MPRKPGTAAESRRLLDRLRALSLDPPRQRELAREIIATEDDMFALEAALNALGDNLTLEERPGLVGRFLVMDADGKRRDPGGHARATLISALRKVATQEDAEIFERAVTTEEFSLQGGTAVLQAAGLLALADLEPERATLHAVRLLAGGGGRQTPEPALSAARLLAAGDEVLPLYLFLLRARDKEKGDILAEALRGLRTLPGELLPAIFETFSEHEDDIVLVGLCDLAIEHEPAGEPAAFIRSLLRSTDRYEVYHYLAASIVASHRADLIALLTEAVPAETDRLKLQSLADALDLIPGEPEIAAVAKQAREKLADMPIDYRSSDERRTRPRRTDDRSYDSAED
jgi:hypothetical protein